MDDFKRPNNKVSVKIDLLICQNNGKRCIDRNPCFPEVGDKKETSVLVSRQGAECFCKRKGMQRPRGGDFIIFNLYGTVLG